MRIRRKKTVALIALCALVLLPATLVLAIPRGRTALRLAPGTAPPTSATQGDASGVRMAFVGDMGTGDSRQAAVRDQMVRVADRLDAVFTMGDNIYENGEAEHFGPRFLDMYRPLFDRGVPFHAALGNHDIRKCELAAADPLPRNADVYQKSRRCWVDQQLTTAEFGYPQGQRYYSVVLGDSLAEVFVLDSNTLASDQTILDSGVDDAQLDWLGQALDESTAVWKLVTMHHTMHTPVGDGFLWKGHGPELALRAQLEPILAGRVDVVFQGHNHLYARMLPQRGIRYFVAGAGGKKPYKFTPDAMTVARADKGRFNHFVYTRITAGYFEYCTIDSDGAIRDGGRFAKGDAADTPFATGQCPLLE